MTDNTAADREVWPFGDLVNTLLEQREEIKVCWEQSPRATSNPCAASWTVALCLELSEQLQQQLRFLSAQNSPLLKNCKDICSQSGRGGWFRFCDGLAVLIA